MLFVTACAGFVSSPDTELDMTQRSANAQCILDEWGECIEEGGGGETNFLLASFTQIGTDCPNFEGQFWDMYTAVPPRVYELDAASWPDSVDGVETKNFRAMTLDCEAEVGGVLVSTPDSPSCRIALRIGDGLAYDTWDGWFDWEFMMRVLRHEIGHVFHPGAETNGEDNWSNFYCFPPV